MTPEQCRSLADVVHNEAFAECTLAETVEGALREAAAQLTAAHALIAQWRKQADVDERIYHKYRDERFKALSAARRACADALEDVIEALLTQQEARG